MSNILGSTTKRLLMAASLALTTVMGALPGAMAAEAGTAPDRQDVSLRIYQLGSELSMLVADIDVATHVEKAGTLMQGLAPDIKTLAAGMRAKDATAADELMRFWQDLEQSVAGATFGESLMPQTLDIAVYASMASAHSGLLQLLGQGLPATSAPPAKQAAFMLHKVTANYLTLTTNPVGGELVSANTNTDDSNLARQAAIIDTLFVQLGERYAKDKAAADQLKRAESMWKFMRSSVLNIGRQSTPMIAYRYGTKAAAILDALEK